MNGDGLGEVLVGAPMFDDGETSEGKAFLIWGQAVGWSDNGEAERAVQWAPR